MMSKARPAAFVQPIDVASLTQSELDEATCSLNSRPRQTLGWMTPSQKLAEALPRAARRLES
jgi:IS30 family transposase